MPLLFLLSFSCVLLLLLPPSPSLRIRACVVWCDRWLRRVKTLCVCVCVCCLLARRRQAQWGRGGGGGLCTRLVGVAVAVAVAAPRAPLQVVITGSAGLALAHVMSGFSRSALNGRRGSARG